MKRAIVCLTLLLVGLGLVSCDSGDDNGTAGGSGTVESTTSPTTAPSAGSDSSRIWLDAFSDFDCSSNWTDRDGALGLKPYSGSGSCTATFSGAPGIYSIAVKIQTEFDGKSPYRIDINGQTIGEGEYPLSSPLGCDCPVEDWKNVCPDRNREIDLGTHRLNPGDRIGFWGDDVYPCGDHGSYAKWHGMTLIRVN